MAAKSFIILSVGLAVVAYLYEKSLPDKYAQDTSASVEKKLSYSDRQPLIGFWKESCNQDFGLAIDGVAGQPDMYSISFCGPGGCFKPGTYRPNSRIVDDPSYNVISSEQLEVRGLDGSSMYHKCP